MNPWISLVKRAREKQLPTKAKRSVATISLMALGVTFELCSRYVKEMQDEIADWEDGRRVCIGVLPKGPMMTIMKDGTSIQFLGLGKKDPHLSILFKNLDSAVLIFTAQLGAPWAVAENRVCIHGDNYQAMQVTRAMAVVQTYLFPGFLLKGIFKRPPVLSGAEIKTKAKIMGLLTPKLVGAAFK